MKNMGVLFVWSIFVKDAYLHYVIISGRCVVNTYTTDFGKPYLCQIYLPPNR